MDKNLPSIDLISHIPVETLQGIFIIVRDEEITALCNGQLSQVSAPEVLSAVSSLWRSVACNMPLLWNFIHIKDEVATTKRLGGQNTLHQSRSINLPLDVFLTRKEESTIKHSLLFEFLPWGRMRHIFLIIIYPQNRPLGNYLLEGKELVADMHQKSADTYTLNVHLLSFTTGYGSFSTAEFKYLVRETGATGSASITLERLAIERSTHLDEYLGRIVNHNIIRVTNFIIVDVFFAQPRPFLQALKLMGPTLTHLELGPFTWKNIPWTWALMHLCNLESLSLCSANPANPSVSANYGAKNQLMHFQSILDALSSVEGKLVKLSRMKIVTTTQYDAGNVIQFIQLVNANTARSPRRFELFVTHVTFSVENLGLLKEITTLAIL